MKPAHAQKEPYDHKAAAKKIAALGKQAVIETRSRGLRHTTLFLEALVESLDNAY